MKNTSKKFMYSTKKTETDVKLQYRKLLQNKDMIRYENEEWRMRKLESRLIKVIL